MGKKITQEEFIANVKLKHPTITVLGKYKGCKERVLCECNVCKYRWSPVARRLSEKQGCPKCGGTKKLTEEEFQNKLKETNPNFIALEPFVNCRTPIKFKCLKCGYEWKAPPNRIIHSKEGCYNCSILNKLYTEEEIKNRLEQLNPKIILKGKYLGTETKTEFQCLECGNTWMAKPTKILNDLTGCPHCNQSKGERCVELYLQQSKIEYEYQKIIKDDIFTQNRIIVDFYIPKSNIIIEYNGEQHYREITFGDLNKEKVKYKFEKQQLRDNQLRQYCNLKNIKLIEIPYYIKFKLIPEYLNNLL